MELDQEQQKELIEKLNELLPEPNECGACGSSDWIVPPTVFELAEFRGPEGKQRGGRVFPVVPIVCANCGNTRMMSAVKLGVVAPGVEEEENLEEDVKEPAETAEG